MWLPEESPTLALGGAGPLPVVGFSSLLNIYSGWPHGIEVNKMPHPALPGGEGSKGD